jgi:cytochrome P450
MQPDLVDETLARTFDLRTLPPAFYDDPFPTYHALRTHDPVKRMPDGSVLLTRHADLVAVYRDSRTFSSAKETEFTPKFGAGTPLLAHHTTSLIFNDPPRHTRVRRLIAGALTARVIADMEPGLIALVDGLLDRIAEKRQFDLIADFAAAIPVDVIGNLLAIPSDQREPLRDWSLAILGALEPTLTPEMHAAGNRAVTEFLAYLEILVADRRRHPGDPTRDVLTRLIQGEDDGGRLSEAELLQNCIFILNAGHETTTNLIGNTLVTLASEPAIVRRLIAEPAVMKPAIEEFLRYESPVQLGNRMTMADTEIAGHRIAAGTGVTLCIGAANRDPEVFDTPDRLDIDRWPNRQLAFAFGIHQCVGLAVARLEGTIAIGRFLRRFPHYRLAAPPHRASRARFRGFLAVPATTT